MVPGKGPPNSCAPLVFFWCTLTACSVTTAGLLSCRDCAGGVRAGSLCPGPVFLEASFTHPWPPQPMREKASGIAQEHSFGGRDASTRCPKPPLSPPASLWASYVPPAEFLSPSPPSNCNPRGSRVRMCA